MSKLVGSCNGMVVVLELLIGAFHGSAAKRLFRDSA